MLEYIRKLWKIEDLRKKILYTFGMLILFRLVGCIPAPGIDYQAVQSYTQSNGLLDMMNMLTGGAMSQMTIMAMGVSPYINASIIMQLLCIALPVLERMQQEEGGREKINRISRYVTIVLAVIQAIGLSNGMGFANTEKYGAWANILIGVSMAGGTALAMWIGERITDKGIGNGISLLIFAGIVSNLFNGIIGGFRAATTLNGIIAALVMLVLLVLLTFVVTYVDLGERRIPLQIAKQVKGRRVYGGQNTHLTLKVVAVGVMPLIFAYSFLSFPGTIGQLVAPNSGFTAWCEANLVNGAWLHLILSALLIFAFTFFYSSISFDAKKQAEQLQQQGATIPGRRGKDIASYLQRTTNRLNLFAALFLAVLAAIPTLLLTLTALLGVQQSVPFAASSMLIAVSVSLETMRTIKGEMAIRGIESDKDNGFM